MYHIGQQRKIEVFQLVAANGVEDQVCSPFGFVSRSEFQLTSPRAPGLRFRAKWSSSASTSLAARRALEEVPRTKEAEPSRLE